MMIVSKLKRNQNKMEEDRVSTPHVSKIKTMIRAIKLSLKMKTPFSLAVLFLGLPAAFLPTFIATKLQILTDALMELSHNQEQLANSLLAFGGLATAFLLSLIYRCLKERATKEDEVFAERYIKRKNLECKCQVKYPYIENKDKFQERMERAEEFAKGSVIRSITEMIGLVALAITFISIFCVLWKVNKWVVLLIVLTSIIAAINTYRQQNETFFLNLHWSETGAMVIYYYGVLAEENFIQDLRHYNLYPHLRKEWKEMANEHARAKRKLLLKFLGLNSMIDFMQSIVYLGVLGITIWQIYKNPLLGLGTFTLVFSLTGQLQSTAVSLFSGVSKFVNSLSYMEEYFYVQDLEREEQGEVKELVEDGEIVFNKVSFTYPESTKEVLHDITLKIKDGEKVAVVGENGSGKSTFISLLCGMLEPDNGQILVGSADTVKETGKVRNSISVVFQNFAKYEDTVKNNIIISDRDKEYTENEIWKILQNLQMEDMIHNQKEGLDTKLGSLDEKGNNLSGGQWQKIALARALYRDRGRIMVLDEPTSALDPMAEAQLYQDFSSLTGDKTTLLISHRLGITSVVDRILVFKEGRIIEDGTHDELFQKGGEYYRMYQAQAQWYQ